MENLFAKLSRYNIVTNLLPGAVLLGAFPASEATLFATNNPIFGIILCYIIGLVVGRVGSLALEPILKKLAPHEPYVDFLKASERDPKIDELSETNNTYRALAATAICYIAIIVFLELKNHFPLIRDNPLATKLAIGFLLAVLFILSYLKQTNFICKRVRAACDSKNDEE